MTAICIIPARGNSQRIPKKNIKHFYGRPIIAYSILRARSSACFDRIVVSTDDEQTAKIARFYGAEVHARSEHGARDDTGTQEVMTEVLMDLKINTGLACCIYPCAPLIHDGDLMIAKRWLEDDLTMFYVMTVGANPLRDAGQWYFGQAVAFFNRAALIGKYTRLFRLPDARVCDINTMDDWGRATKLYREMWGG